MWAPQSFQSKTNRNCHKFFLPSIRRSKASCTSSSFSASSALRIDERRQCHHKGQTDLMSRAVLFTELKLKGFLNHLVASSKSKILGFCGETTEENNIAPNKNVKAKRLFPSLTHHFKIGWVFRTNLCSPWAVLWLWLSSASDRLENK